MPVKKNLMVRFFAIIECHIYISFFDDLKKNGVYKKSLNVGNYQNKYDVFSRLLIFATMHAD